MSFALYCMLFGILVFFPERDAGGLTWKEPFPTQTVPDNNRTNHFGEKVLREGNTNVTMRWHFVLTDLAFDSLAISFGGQVIAGVRSSAQGPQPGFENQFGINWIASQNLAVLFIFNVTTEVNGVFTCVVSAVRGVATFQFSSIVQVNVVAPPSKIVTSIDQTIKAPTELALNCSADGKPKPTLTWTRVSDSTVVTMPLNITGRKDAGSYRCTADNGFGDPQRKDVKVNVLFSPKVTLANKFFVGREQTASLICQVEGNPKPIISWSHCDRPNRLCNKQYLNISKVQRARANYTCTASNYLGSESATTVLLIGGNDVYVRLSVNGKCKDKDSVWETLENELRRVFANTSYIKAQRIDVSCGSLIFDVVLEFSIKVAEDDTISTIQTAVRDGKLGQLSVNASYAIGRLPVVPSTSTLIPTSTSRKSDGTASAPSIAEPTSLEQEGTASAPSITEPTSLEQEGTAGPAWAIIGGATGGVAVLAIVVGVLAWWVHKQRKCGNDTKIHSSGQERHGAYAQSGPPAANGTEGAAEQEIEVAAAIPSYAVVNKSKKKKLREEVPPVYAEVDKSKKKKKKIDDKNLYEILDEPKKDKKPGELLYADLGDFKNPGMPTVSTSPQPLPAIKKADPYERTDYADITQFLKGNATFPPSDGNGDTEMKPERPSKRKIQGMEKETPI